MPEKLKPCPFCSSTNLRHEDGYGVWCLSCNSDGPRNDPSGAKWNFVSRTDASQGMSDGELSARVAIGAIRWDNPWPFKQIDDESIAWHLANQAEVRAELDRRADARKESKS